MGLPFIEHKVYGGKEYAVTEYTMSEIVASVYDRIRDTGLKEGILFIDEINCVSETLAPAMLQFLQCKTFGTHKIPEGWIIVAAGNPPEYNKSVREFDVVTLDRVKKIDIEEDFGVWKGVCVPTRHPRRDSVLSRDPARAFLPRRDHRRRTAVCHRTRLEDLSELMQVYESLGIPVDRQVVEQYLQLPQVASDFANICSFMTIQAGLPRG